MVQCTCPPLSKIHLPHPLPYALPFCHVAPPSSPKLLPKSEVLMLRPTNISKADFHPLPEPLPIPDQTLQMLEQLHWTSPQRAAAALISYHDLGSSGSSSRTSAAAAAAVNLAAVSDSSQTSQTSWGAQVQGQGQIGGVANNIQSTGGQASFAVVGAGKAVSSSSGIPERAGTRGGAGSAAGGAKASSGGFDGGLSSSPSMNSSSVDGLIVASSALASAAAAASAAGPGSGLGSEARSAAAAMADFSAGASLGLDPWGSSWPMSAEGPGRGHHRHRVDRPEDLVAEGSTRRQDLRGGVAEGGAPRQRRKRSKRSARHSNYSMDSGMQTDIMYVCCCGGGHNARFVHLRWGASHHFWGRGLGVAERDDGPVLYTCQQILCSSLVICVLPVVC